MIRKKCKRCTTLLGLGGAASGGRGLCAACRHLCIQDGTLYDYPLTMRTRDEVLNGWIELSSRGYSRRDAAEYLGMSWKAFDRMWWRARAAGDWRADDNPQRRTA